MKPATFDEVAEVRNKIVALQERAKSAQQFEMEIDLDLALSHLAHAETIAERGHRRGERGGVIAGDMMTIKFSTIWGWIVGIFAWDLTILPLMQKLEFFQDIDRHTELMTDAKMAFLLAAMMGVCYLRKSSKQ